MSSFELGAHHGTKRPAPTEDAEGDQRLSKRLNGLSLNYTNPHAPPKVAHVPPPPKTPAEERMYLDDTKDTVYIHDLDAELAELEDRDEPNIEFLPEIEKKLAAFPSLLETRALSPSEGQLILYRPISFPEEIKTEQRKAIIEARRKAREEDKKRKSQEKIQHVSAMNDVGRHGIEATQLVGLPDHDPDAMEIE